MIDLDEIEKKIDDCLNNETPETLKKWLSDYRAKHSANTPVIKSVCECTHTQACEICAESKDIDWSIIKG